ncbi:DNA mismatch repair protein MutS [Enhydrobacter aerosaccus]|uniref:DNA mismatch repair protein MutS n=1 Tax=Enhydrobacter aerosaccus TaxID=225324 RepID=A0ABR5IN17_9HYPH|nr:DNA mismatch repair protein MutS [Enhydrobacter aerosaccus]KND22443.1 DNA mismatch repair protein MutS [Enhydrobacter aerosaccus]
MPQTMPHNLDHHTPMMQQYLTLKADYPHALVLYRMGDFYELFFDDAKLAADILGITLTRRGNDKQGNTIPMAGVPFHSADGYIARLINAGQTVVVCEQVEEEKPEYGSEENPEHNLEDNIAATDTAAKSIAKKTSKTKANAAKIMERKVVRTLTAGTLTDDSLITQGQTPTVVAISFAKQQMSVGLAQLDLAQGQIRVTELNCDSHTALQSELANALARFDPSEVLIDEQLSEAWQHFLQDCLSANSPTASLPPILSQPHSYFLPNNALEHLTQHLSVTTLAGFGIEQKPLAISSASVVLHYGKQTQQADLRHIRSLQLEHNGDFLQLDTISQQNLEIFKPVLASGISLLSVIDHCQTPMGKRALVHHLHRPLRNVTLINRRLDAVEQLMTLPIAAFELLKQTLSEISDIERIGGRIGLGSAKPTDLLKLRLSLAQALALSKQLQQYFDFNNITTLSADTPLLAMLSKQLPDLALTDSFANIYALLEQAIVDEPPAHIRDGGMIKKGYDPQLDELQNLHGNIEQTLEALAVQERQKNNLPMLKVGFNKVSGFYFELSALQAKNAPEYFTRRQTLKNAERFITPALKTIEESYLSAQGQALTLEKRIYENLLGQLKSQLGDVQRLAKAIGYLDVLANWVSLTRLQNRSHHNKNWCRPLFNTKDDTASLNIQGGRHIVVEAGQQRQAHHQRPSLDPFVANDCVMGTANQLERLMLITGPNMGGKSTYMRQTALIVLLACCGAYVPAQSVTLGRIERIFTRIGSADDLASGKSTFMVEMIETANIMNQANANSLVLMDEVGRGTSTQDGLAIAHACVNYLAEKIGCLTLFATHYFELTELAERHPKMFNQHLVTQEINGQLLLLHKIAPGATHRSFGLHVAKMAGLPQALLVQAQYYLDNHSEQKSLPNNPLPYPSEDEKQMGLDLQSAAADYQTLKTDEYKLNQQLQALNPDELTPKQALEFIYSLKELLKKA